MNHYLVKLNMKAWNAYDIPLRVVVPQLVKATHSDKAIEIAKRNHSVYWLLGVKSCNLVSNVDVSILKAYL